MSYLREALLDYIEELEQDTLASNRVHAKALRDMVEECDRLDDR